MTDQDQRPATLYRKKALMPARAYVPGEDLIGVSVSPGDSPEQGGMIMWDPQDPSDQWYINPEYFKENYEAVPPAMEKSV